LLVLAFYKPEKESPSFSDFKEKARDIDWLGMAIFIPAISCLILALQGGGTQYPWANVRIIVLLISCGVLLITFTYIQIRRQKLATLPPHIVRQRRMEFGLTFAFCGACTLSIVDFYVSYCSSRLTLMLISCYQSFQSGFKLSKESRLFNQQS